MSTRDERPVIHVRRNDNKADEAWSIGSPTRRELPLTLLSEGVDAIDYPVHAIDDVGNVMTTTGEGLKGTVTFYIWYQNIQSRLFTRPRSSLIGSNIDYLRGNVVVSEGATEEQKFAVIRAFEMVVRLNTFGLNSTRLCLLSTLSVWSLQPSGFIEMVEVSFV